MSKQWQLAQLNVARMLAPIDSPRLSEFVENLDRLNAIADEAPGFVWRLQSDAGDATGFRPFGEDILVNMSLWEDVESLHHYVYKTSHVEIMRKRRQWFELMRDNYTVLWWVPAGTLPDLLDAKERLAKLRESGPSPEAFTFNDPFPHPGSSHVPEEVAPDCPAQ